MRLSYRPIALWLSTASVFPSSAFGFTAAASRSPLFTSKSTARRMSSLDENASSKSLRVALCQFHVTPAKDDNKVTAKSYLAKAKESGADLVVLPEVRSLFVSGLDHLAFFFSPYISDSSPFLSCRFGILRMQLPHSQNMLKLYLKLAIQIHQILLLPKFCLKLPENTRCGLLEGAFLKKSMKMDKKRFTTRVWCSIPREK